MEIVVMGSCRKCAMTYDVFERVIRESGCDARLTKVDDIRQMLDAGVRTMPAVVIDGRLVLKGYVPSDEQVREILGVG